MLYYNTALNIENVVCLKLSQLLHEDMKERKTWRILSPYKRAVLVLAHFKDDVGFEKLSLSFQLGLATAWRYVNEALNILQVHAPHLKEVVSNFNQKLHSFTRRFAYTYRSC